MLRDLEDTLLAKDKDPDVKDDATTKQLVRKHMHQIAKSQDISKEEASFCLSGGQVKYNSKSRDVPSTKLNFLISNPKQKLQIQKPSVKLLIVEATILGPTWPFISGMKSTVKRQMDLFH